MCLWYDKESADTYQMDTRPCVLLLSSVKSITSFLLQITKLDFLPVLKI